MYAIKHNPKLKLCYVEGNFAYFTTAKLDEQWGDDWDDAPYEHNAGLPYEMEGEELLQVGFNVYLRTPRDNYSNSPYSVQDINNGKVPWLTSPTWVKERESVKIMAGTSLKEFVEKIQEIDGTVFFPHKIKTT